MKKLYEMPVINLLDGDDTDMISTSRLEHISGGGVGDLLLWEEL